jgi:UrcA family protein
MSETSVNLSARTSATRRAIYTAFSTAALALFGGGAHASDLYAAPAEKVVSYEDLDLSLREGAQILYSRLQGAAMQVCGTPDLRNLRQTQLQRQCYEKALAEAVATVDKSSLTALYRSDKAIRLAGA